MAKKIFKNLVNNKRIIYLLSICILLGVCLILNITFSIFTASTNLTGANISVGDLDYKMVINEVNLESTVGIKDKTNTIIGDRIIKLKAGKTEQFNIFLTSLNAISTKYEITYKFCEDQTCSRYIDNPVGVDIFYAHNTKDEITGIIEGNYIKDISLITVNALKIDYYVQLGLNVGYSTNDLKLKNDIGTVYNPGDFDGNSNLKIIAYVDGKEVEVFPTEPNYETSVMCTYSDGTISEARGIFTYNNGWKLNVYEIDRNLTTCRVDFTEKLYITYELLATRYNCANKQETVDDPIISYTGDCSIHNDATETTNSNAGDWRIKFLSDGTLTVAGMVYIDAFLVGGGAGGRSAVYCGFAGAGGGGGYTYTHKNIKLLNKDENDNPVTYTIDIGAGGAANAAGNPTNAFGYQAKGASDQNGGSGGGGGNRAASPGGTGGSYGNNGGIGWDNTYYNHLPPGTGQGKTTCEFEEGTLSSCINGTNFAYSGGGGGGGAGDGYSTTVSTAGIGGGTGHSGGAVKKAAIAGIKNRGGGGGGGGSNSECGYHDAGAAGGDGVVVIRNVRT